MKSNQVPNAVKALHYVSPFAVSSYFLLAQIWNACTVQSPNAVITNKLRRTILVLQFVIAIDFTCEAGLIIAQLFTTNGQFANTDSNIYSLSSALMWVVLSASLLGAEQYQWYPYYGAWLLTLLMDLVCSALNAGVTVPSAPLEWAQVALQMIRVLLLVLLVALYFSLRQSTSIRDEETTPLLAGSRQDSQSSSRSSKQYGISNTMQSAEHIIAATYEDEAVESERKIDTKIAQMRKSVYEQGSWLTYLKEFSVFVPLIWPTKKPLLQANMVGVAICILANRALNILAPRQLGILTNALTTGSVQAPFVALTIYFLVDWLKSYAGIEGLRTRLWLPVETNADQALDTAFYNHITELSCDFHDQNRSGEIYVAMRQVRSIVQLLDVVLHQLLPLMMDLFLGCIYFYFLFDSYLVFIGIVVIVVYAWVSALFASRAKVLRRKFNATRCRKDQVLYDTMGSWRTVSYFNRIPHAQETYNLWTTLYNEAWMRTRKHWYSTYTIKSMIIQVGGLSAMAYATYQIAYAGKDVGSFIALVAFWRSFTAQLPFVATIHHQLLQKLVDVEELLRLFKTQPNVQDGPNELCLRDGLVQFDKVSFSYDGKTPVIKKVSLHARPQQTVALIGETGGGKSTLLKLLFRFYDPKAGSIKIDGQDIRNVTLSSLREHIGVVPQDPSLFNDTIMANVRYARLDATDEEVIEACKAAAVHEKILRFADGYQTRVGEHAIKLSGGELQQIAIARAILKDSKIVLLDEATSSVDSETENHIQEGLCELSHGRTVLVVAHRLSTIANADHIIVIKDGKVVEQGHSEQLRRDKGDYYHLWAKQMDVVDSMAKDEDEEKSGSSKEAVRSDENTSGTFEPSRKSRRQARVDADASIDGSDLKHYTTEDPPIPMLSGDSQYDFTTPVIVGTQSDVKGKSVIRGPAEYQTMPAGGAANAALQPYHVHPYYAGIGPFRPEVPQQAPTYYTTMSPFRPEAPEFVPYYQYLQAPSWANPGLLAYQNQSQVAPPRDDTKDKRFHGRKTQHQQGGANTATQESIAAQTEMGSRGLQGWNGSESSRQQTMRSRVNQAEGPSVFQGYTLPEVSRTEQLGNVGNVGDGSGVSGMLNTSISGPYEAPSSQGGVMIPILQMPNPSALSKVAPGSQFNRPSRTGSVRFAPSPQ